MGRFIPLEKTLKTEGYDLIAGIDEAGRGPLAGPVVSCAIILKPNARIKGLDDSKKLSAKAREALFPVIIANALDYAITVVSHRTIDEINILKSVQLANKLCVEHLQKTPCIAVIDGKDKQTLEIPYRTVIKGDSKIKSIAAASVLAKVVRDRIMDYYDSEFGLYNFAQHKGYGTREHRSLISTHGFCEIHRKTFKFVAP